MKKLKFFLVSVKLILLISSVNSYDKDLLEELVSELKSLEKSLRKTEKSDNNPSTVDDTVHLTTEANDNEDLEKRGGNAAKGSEKDGFDDKAEECQNCWKLPSESDIVRAIMKDISIGKNPSKACGEDQPLVILDQSGIIHSPGFENNTLSSHLNCSWRIVTSKGLVTKITFTVLDLPFAEDCSLNFVEIFDVRGGMPISIGKYCGSTVPSELLKSSGQDLYLFFATGSVSRPGRFSVKFESVDGTPHSLSSSNCGRPSIKPDMTRSFSSVRPALAGSWPWQVSIRLVSEDQRNSHICGGSIIKPDVVLTVAHCWFLGEQRVNTSEYEVVAGEYDLLDDNDGPVQVSSIKELIVHEKYQISSNNSDDIALVVLESPFVFGERIQNVCLPKEDFVLTDLCYSTGWSDSKHNGDRTILHQTHLQIIPQMVCQSSLSSNTSQLTEKQFCAARFDREKEACQGDSGGPFVCYNEESDRWFQFGVKSFLDKYTCADQDVADIYLRVTKYLDWITKNSKVRL